MSFNPAPSGYFPNISVGEVVSGTTGVFIPWTDLENFNTSTSGDIRQLVYSFNEAVANTFLSLSASNTPSQLSIRRTQTFPSANIIRKTYTNIVNLAFSGTLLVANE